MTRTSHGGIRRDLNLRIEASVRGNSKTIGRGRPTKAISDAIRFLEGVGIDTKEIKNINTSEIETLSKLLKGDKRGI